MVLALFVIIIMMSVRTIFVYGAASVERFNVSTEWQISSL